LPTGISGLRRDDGAEEEKTFLDALSNFVRPFDYIVKAGQTARPKTVTENKENSCHSI